MKLQMLCLWIAFYVISQMFIEKLIDKIDDE